MESMDGIKNKLTGSRKQLGLVIATLIVLTR
jgi:hypothetical protein